MDECIFCKISQSKLPSFKVYEDDNYLAFLDIFPKNTAQTNIIPKKHLPSKLTKNDQEEILNLMKIALKVANKIESKLPEVERCQLVIEGLELDHLHIKLFPTFFPEPKDYVVSRSGDRESNEELQKIADLINN